MLAFVDARRKLLNVGKFFLGIFHSHRSKKKKKNRKRRRKKIKKEENKEMGSK